MAIQSAFFPLDGSNKTFPSTKHIATKQHVAIWLQVREDGSYVQLSSNQYDLINNSIVLKEVPSATIYRRVEVRVADNVDELTTSLSDIAIVASIAGDIVEVVETVVPNMDEILQADDNAAIATTQAGISTTKAGEASASATTATTQAGIATTKAGEASTSASNASTSESNALDYRDTTLGYRDEAETFRDEASTSATNTANIYDEFDDRYLGAKATPPAVDNDGDPLIVGALFFDTTANQMKVYDGSTWQIAGSSVSGIAEQYSYTATQGQDTFTATYDVGFVYVYVNGVRLFDNDYTATNGTSVELTEALNAGDSVEIVAFGTFEVANTYTKGEADALLADKADVSYVDDELDTKVDKELVTIATGSATFTNTDNNIALTNIGVGVEIGDVLQISGSTNNDTEFTVEVITDDDNVIVNQAHAGGATTKSLVNETATVTVKLLAKWYEAPLGLGQGWVDVNGVSGVPQDNTTQRAIIAKIFSSNTSTIKIFVDGLEIVYSLNGATNTANSSSGVVPIGSVYTVEGTTIWTELR